MTEKGFHRAAVLITLSVFIILILPWLVQDGMFMDGMIYSTVARNLSLGYGSFWDLHLSKHLNTFYRDQPPLTIWITSFFFKIFGYGMYTERIYSFTTAVINLLLIRAIWKKINRTDEKKMQLWWLPVLLWIIPPACFWSFANNMEENTMSVFILTSVYFMIEGFYFRNKVFLNIFLTVIFLALAALCKGVQGTFAASGIFFLGLIFKEKTLPRAVAGFLIVMAGIFLTGFFIFLYKPAANYLVDYYRGRIVHTFSDPSSATTPTRFYILLRLMMEMISPLLIMFIILFASGKKRTKTSGNSIRWSRWFLFIALAGTIPLMITAEQRRFYLVPVYPFYALAIAVFCHDKLMALIEKIRGVKFLNGLKVAAYILFTTSVIFSFLKTGKTKRDETLLHDVYSIGKIIPSNEEIGLAPALYDKWSIHLYFQRYYGISLDPANIDHNYFLTEKEKSSDFLSDNFTKVNAGLEMFDLYKRK